MADKLPPMTPESTARDFDVMLSTPSRPNLSSDASPLPPSASRSRRRTSLGDSTEVSVPIGLTEGEVRELQEVFLLFDTDGSGRVAPALVRAAAEEAGLAKSNPEVWRLLSGLSSTDPVDFEDFIMALTEPLGCPSTVQGSKQLLNAVSQDAVKQESIGLQDLKCMVDELGLDISLKTLEAMLEKVELNDEKRLELPELRRILLKASSFDVDDDDD